LPTEECERLPRGDDTLPTRAVAHARTVTTAEPGVPTRAFERLARAGYRHCAAVPMVHQGKVMGALWAGRRGGAIPAEDMEFLRAAGNQIAAAVEHARVFEQLAATSARLEAVLRCAPEGILVLDVGGRLVYHNAEVQRIYGIEGRDLMGWTTRDLRRELGSSFADPSVPADIERRIAEEPLRTHRMEYEIAQPVHRRIARTSAPVLSEGGEFLGQVIVLHEHVEPTDDEAKPAKRTATRGRSSKRRDPC
jgi:PAS domain S-box-containing protein